MRFWVTAALGIAVISAIATVLWVGDPTIGRIPVSSGTDSSSVDTSILPIAETGETNLTVTNLPQFHQGESKFTITNAGKSPLKLQPGKPSCVCAGVELEKKVLQPGESTPFVIKWDTRERLGEFVVRATVYTNDPHRGEVYFSVYLSVQPQVIVEPTELNWGPVTQGDKVSKQVFIYSTRVKDLELKEPECSVDWLHTKTEPMSPAEQKKREATSGFVVTVWPEGKPPIGSFLEKIQIPTNDPQTQHITLKAFLDIEGAIQLFPRELSFETAKMREIEVFAKGLSPESRLEIGEIQPDFVTATISRDPNHPVRWTLRAVVAESAPPGPFRGRVAVLDEKGNPRLNIPVSGIVSSRNEIPAQPNSKTNSPKSDLK